MPIEERVAALEARIESLATKEDIVRLETRMDAWENYGDYIPMHIWSR